MNDHLSHPFNHLPSTKTKGTRNKIRLISNVNKNCFNYFKRLKQYTNNSILQ